METENKDTQAVETVEQETTIKTYTEEEMQAKTQESFKAGVKKANSDWQKDEDYKAFLNWKKTNQNDSEKLSQLETENKAKDEEINSLKAKLILKDSDVKKEYSDFVRYEVSKKVDDTVSFETALKNYKKENPQYFGETVVTKVQSSPSMQGGQKSQTTNDTMNNLLRGYKNK